MLREGKLIVFQGNSDGNRTAFRFRIKHGGGLKHVLPGRHSLRVSQALPISASHSTLVDTICPPKLTQVNDIGRHDRCAKQACACLLRSDTPELRPKQVATVVHGTAVGLTGAGFFALLSLHSDLVRGSPPILHDR